MAYGEPSERTKTYVKYISSNLNNLMNPTFHGDDGERVYPGQLGENVTTVGVELLGLSKGTKLRVFNQEEGRSVFMFGNTGIGMLLDLLVRLAFWIAIISALVFGAGGIWVTVAVHLVVIFLHITTAYTKASGEDTAVATFTALRIPYKKIDTFWQGLKQKSLFKDGTKIVGRKSGVLGIVTTGGVIKLGMSVIIEPPKEFEEIKPIP